MPHSARNKENILLKSLESPSRQQQTYNLRRTTFFFNCKVIIFIKRPELSCASPFFLSRFSFTDTDNSQDSRGREGTIFYSTLLLPPTHEHSDIYLQLCTWGALSHIFNCNASIYQTATRWDLPTYRITIWFNDYVMLLFVCLLVDLVLGFVTGYFTWETGGHELATTIILVLQANRLTKLCK